MQSFYSSSNAQTLGMFYVGCLSTKSSAYACIHNEALN